MAVALAEMAAKALGRADCRAEAMALGMLETIEAKAVGLILVDMEDERASVGTAVALVAFSIEETLLAVTLLAANIEETLPVAMEDKLPADKVELEALVGTMVELFNKEAEEALANEAEAVEMEAESGDVAVAIIEEMLAI